MSRSIDKEARTKRIAVTIERASRSYCFKLCRRPIELGPFATVQYYWMDSTEFRNLGSKREASNYFNCLQHWWESMQLGGDNHDLDQQIHYVFAQAYPLFCRSKSVQHVYRDAFLSRERRGHEDDADCLPDEDRVRIADIVRSRDRDQAKAELDMALQRYFPGSDLMPALREACRRWVGNGVVLWREHGSEGLKQWLSEVERWAEKYRHRRGVKPLVRRFVSMFAYEAKISFYTCYANAWIDIIPELRRRHALDGVSERFMRLWHNQNQPVKIPHGRTRGGIYYPTKVNYQILVAGAGGRVGTHYFSISTEHIGPTHVPDVFSGQVLSLHPLSGIFMTDPALCAVAGRLVTSDRFDQIGSGDVAEYWEFVGAILTAANIYRRSAQEQEVNRGRYQRGNITQVTSGCCNPTQDSMLLEDFASAQKIACPQCHGPVRYRAYTVTNEGCQVCLDFHCPKCDRKVTESVDASVLKDWLSK